MADSIEVKELPEVSKRMFNRIGSDTLTPDFIYDAEEVPKEDRAVFEISPANPLVRDELKQIILAKTVLQADVAEGNNINITDLAQTPQLVLEEAPKKETKAKREQREHRNKVSQLIHLGTCERIALAIEQIRQATEAMMSTKEARELLSECIKVSNYKEDNGKKLIVSKKNNKDILLSMPDILAVWCFTQVQHMSNLTDGEVLGY